MNGTSGFQEVRSSTPRLQAHRLLREQRHRFGTGLWDLLLRHDVGLSTRISKKRKELPNTLSILSVACLILISLITGCASGPPPDKVHSSHFYTKDYVVGQSEKVKAAIAKCNELSNPAPQVITSDTITLNIKICVAYTGDGPRPLNPWAPEDWEVGVLETGEVYFIAFIKDLGAETQKLSIQSDLISDVVRSQNYLYNYDLYHGSPTEALEVYVGVFDDDGWPSDRTEKLKSLQRSVGQTLDLFPAAAPMIPFLQPFLDLIPAVMDLFDPDDNLVSGRVIITKKKVHVNGKEETQWTLGNPVIHNDNGKIMLTITP
jgi:hypothetical protein